MSNDSCDGEQATSGGKGTNTEVLVSQLVSQSVTIVMWVQRFKVLRTQSPILLIISLRLPVTDPIATRNAQLSPKRLTKEYSHAENHHGTFAPSLTSM